MNENRTYSTFAGDTLVASGDLKSMLRATKAYLDASAAHTQPPLLILDDSTGRPTDFDFRGSLQDVLHRAAPSAAPRGPGRPRLGVVSREVTLLPRQWQWLAEQPSGASATLRRLVDQAKANEGTEAKARRAAVVTGQAMTVLAGDRPNYEEAYRALDAGDGSKFAALTQHWPEAIRGYLRSLAADAFGAEPG